MRKLYAIAAGCLIILATAALTHGQAVREDQDPAAVHQELQTLQAELDDVREEIADVEFRRDRVGKAVANAEHVRDRNAAIIERLEEWVAAE